MSRRSVVPASALLSALFCFLLLPGAAAADDVQFGLRASAWLEDADPALGLEVVVPFRQSKWAFNPNAEVVFSGDRDRWVLSADFLRSVGAHEDLGFYGGAGITWIHRDGNRRHSSENDAGLNLIAGVGWRYQRIVPYAQVKVVLADDAEAVAAVGIRF
jgi:hypothetical protein